VGVGEAIVGSYEGEFSNDEVHGHGTHTAKAAWSFTGALAHDRPTQGELTEADGRRFAVQYAADCAPIQKHPTPSSKVRVGSVAPRGRTSMVLQRRRSASATLLVPACAGVCVCPATEHRPHLTTWTCPRTCWRLGAQAALRASGALRWAAAGGAKERARAAVRRAWAGEGRRARAGTRSSMRQWRWAASASARGCMLHCSPLRPRPRGWAAPWAGGRRGAAGAEGGRPRMRSRCGRT
jgi:hypothetical protein